MDLRKIYNRIIEKVKSLKNRGNKKANYILTHKVKTLFGSILIIISCVRIIEVLFSFEPEGVEVIVEFLVLVLNILLSVTGMGLIVLDESQRKNEDEKSINIFIGKQLFEKGLYGIIVGVLVGSLTFILNMFGKIL